MKARGHLSAERDLFGGSVWPFVFGLIALAMLWFAVTIEVLT